MAHRNLFQFHSENCDSRQQKCTLAVRTFSSLFLHVTKVHTLRAPVGLRVGIGTKPSCFLPFTNLVFQRTCDVECNTPKKRQTRLLATGKDSITYFLQVYPCSKNAHLSNNSAKKNGFTLSTDLSPLLNIYIKNWTTRMHSYTHKQYKNVLGRDMALQNIYFSDFPAQQ